MGSSETGPEQASLVLHSLPSESDRYSEGSAAMDMCVKTEPDAEDISNRSCCTEVRSSSDEELDSALLLDDDNIKQETIMVKIKENCELEVTDEVKVEQFSQFQELNFIKIEINEAADYSIKAECTGLQFNELISVPCSSAKLERDEVKVEQFSPVQEAFTTGTTVEEAVKEENCDPEVDEFSSVACPSSTWYESETKVPHDQKSFLGLRNNLAAIGNDVQGEGALEESVGPVSCDVTAQKWQCHQCRRIFKSQSQLDIHLQTQCDDKYCVQCFTTSSQMCHFKGHQLFDCGKQYKYNKSGRNASQSANLKQHQIIRSGKKQYKCSECGKTFSKGGNLKQHQRVHSGEKPFKCSECGKCFSQRANLKQHQFVHSGEKPYKCSECGKSFSYLGNLNLHLSVHSGEKPYTCGQCGKSFSQGIYLKQHQLIHSSEKPYGCKECGKSFSKSRSLKLHQLIHYNEKPYKCDECGKIFSQPGNLKQHQLVHSGEKPFKCSQCGKSFSQRANLKKHQFVHSGEKPYKCSECGKTFSQGSNLKQHQRIHSGEKPYKCSDCGRCFALRQYLKIHEKTH